MTTPLFNMTPLMPEGSKADQLKDLALAVIQKSAALGSQQNAVTLGSLRDMLRIINSYYSNLIEGHNTHPYDIVRAMEKGYDAEPAKRNLQKESLAHIAIQGEMEKRLADDSRLNVVSREFLCYLHREFYEKLPDDFRIVKDPETGRERTVIPGELRDEGVKVGRHVPPESDSLKGLLDRFEEFYAPDKHHGAEKVIALAAAHHRLMWIHPFLDGNGRVARLLAEAYFHRVPVAGFGLWSVSRGLARRNADYKAALSAADAPRRNDLDGRGNLSNEGLMDFCRFFLDVCLDQVDYMGNMLRLDGLVDRIKSYIDMRERGAIPGPSGKTQPLRPEAARMLQEVLVYGTVTRGDVIKASGLKERTGRSLLGLLLDERLLISDSPKGEVRLGFPIHAAAWFFPDLYPSRF
jgi:Fic family protein